MQLRNIRGENFSLCDLCYPIVIVFCIKIGLAIFLICCFFFSLRCLGMFLLLDRTLDYMEHDPEKIVSNHTEDDNFWQSCQKRKKRSLVGFGKITQGRKDAEIKVERFLVAGFYFQVPKSKFFHFLTLLGSFVKFYTEED